MTGVGGWGAAGCSGPGTDSSGVWRLTPAPRSPTARQAQTRACFTGHGQGPRTAAARGRVGTQASHGPCALVRRPTGSDTGPSEACAVDRPPWAPPPASSAVTPGRASVSRPANGAEKPRRPSPGRSGAGAPAPAASGRSPRAEWAAVPARAPDAGGRRALPGPSRSALQSVWPAECAALLCEAGDPAQRGLLSPQAPSAKTAIVRAARPAGGAWSSAHAPAKGGPRPGRPGQRHSRLSAAALPGPRRLAPGRMNARFCLLSYFIYIF